MLKRDLGRRGGERRQGSFTHGLTPRMPATVKAGIRTSIPTWHACVSLTQWFSPLHTTPLPCSIFENDFVTTHLSWDGGVRSNTLLECSEYGCTQLHVHLHPQEDMGLIRYFHKSWNARWEAPRVIFLQIQNCPPPTHGSC